jgi:aminoglycoside 3'-phosphotransferase-1
MPDDAHEHATRAIDLPASLAALVDGRRWSRNIVGISGDAVYRLRDPERRAATDLFLKHAHGPGAFDLAGEMVRLGWLGWHITVPAVRAFFAQGEEAWLLIDALPGQTAYQLLDSRPDDRIIIVDAISQFLRRLHAIPVESCPFNSDHHLRLGEARWRLDHGLVDAEDFDAEHRGWSAEQVWAELSSLLPFDADRVVTHGDLSLDNIVISDDATVGCIDVGRAGIADRYQDLAILWNCLSDFGPALQTRLFTSYGIDRPDEAKIRFHLSLDELF